MTFKATIKTAGVTTTDSLDVTLLTPDGHEIGGASAVYAYDRLHSLVGQYCKPGTVRGNGHADDMGRALGAVLENQQGVLRTVEREREEARAGLRDFSNLAQRLEAELREAREAKASVEKSLRTVQHQRDQLEEKLSLLQCSVRYPQSIPHGGTFDHARHEIEQTARRWLPCGVATEYAQATSPDVPPGIVRIVFQTNCPAAPVAPAPAITKDTPVTLGMLRELHQDSSDLCDARYRADRERNYQRRVEDARMRGRPIPPRMAVRPLPGSTMVEALDRKLGGR